MAFRLTRPLGRVRIGAGVEVGVGTIDDATLGCG